MKWILVFLLALSSFSAFAGAKEDFVKAVVDQCKKSADDAEKMATPGRTGTVIQFKLCQSSPVDAGEGCKLTCTKDGSNLGN